MSKPVLLIDPICKQGHVSFNSTWVRALVDQGFAVTFVGASDYLSPAVLALCTKVIFFRPGLKHGKGKFLSRVEALWRLAQVRALAHAESDAPLLFTDFEELTFYASGLSRSAPWCVCHATVEHLKNGVKRACARRIFRNATAVSFNAHIRAGLCGFGIQRVVVTPHGLPQPFEAPSDLAARKRQLSGGRRIVFIPSAREADAAFLSQLRRSDSFLRFLGERDLVLVTRGEVLGSSSRMVRDLPGFLSPADYEGTFLAADVVFIPYARDLRHRVSNVLFESIANGKPVVMLHNEAMEQFRAHFSYDPFIRTEAELKVFLGEFLEGKKSYGFNNLEALRPKFDFLGDPSPSFRQSQ